MALGNQYNNNNKQQKKSPTVYSAYKLKNAESKVDATQLLFSYWNGMLRMTIEPKIENTNDEIPRFDDKNSVSIYLSHTKARLLLNELILFKQDPNQYNNVGVDSGSGFISFSNGKEFGVKGIFIIIRRINPNTGVIESSFAYQIKEDFHYAIRNFDQNTMNFDKQFYNNLELDQIEDVLQSYVQSMTGAYAYTVIDNMKYDVSRMSTKIELVMDKLGIERKAGSGGYRNRSIFNNGNSSDNGSQATPTETYTNATIDDIESQL